jgi:geranylgeranyl pyrophosphate synthase
MSTYASECQRRVDGALEQWLPSPGPEGEGRLAAAMHHAVLGGGKRLRPVTVLAACRAVGGEEQQALAGACAVELVHAYSLVHDDLPAMDDDVERRGRPTVHVAYDEATAILAGDALLTLAFEVLGRSDPAVEPARRLGAIHELAHLAGHAGLVGGQSLDLQAAGRSVATLEELERIHRGKTAALFRASALIGGLLGGGSPDAVETLTRFGEELGLAFQHADDRLDEEHLHLQDRAAERLRGLLQSARTRAQGFGEPGAALLGLVERVERYAP